MKRMSYYQVMMLAIAVLSMWITPAEAQQAAPTRILIHMKRRSLWMMPRPARCPTSRG